MKTNVLVTGGSGFIGSNLSRALAGLVNVTIVDDLSSGDTSLISDISHKVEFIQGDFASRDILSRVESGEFSVVFHLAAVPRVGYSVEEPYETTVCNVSKTVALMQSCIRSKKKPRFIFSSSSAVYGDTDQLPTPVTATKQPLSPYAWQKSCIEDLLVTFHKLYGLDCISLRYFNVFGPGQYGDSAYSTAISAWCHAVKNKKPLRKDGTGEQSRDMCYVDNVVSSNMLAMNSSQCFNGIKLNVACGDRVSNNEILSFFNSRFSDIQIKNAPFRQGDVMHTQADISLTEKVLGYSPTVKFWDGLEKTLQWWKI